MEYALSTRLFVEQRLTSHILDQILATGIRQIEIFAARQHLDYYDSNHVRDVAQWFSDHGVTLHSLHAPLFTDFDWGRSGGLPVSVAYLEKRLRIDSMDEIKRAMDVAERLPFRYLVLHLGLPEDEYDPRRFDAAFTSLEHLKVFGKERGTELLLENTPSDLGTAERLIQFIQYTRLDLKICFDAGHAHMSGGVQSAFEIAKPYLASIEIHDNHRQEDEHLLPFEGEIDWAQTFRDVRSWWAAGGKECTFPILLEPHLQGSEAHSLSRVHQAIVRLDSLEERNTDR
jgi:sugar phosphate isomerase/epimerase